jgi:hypothetical protein
MEVRMGGNGITTDDDKRGPPTPWFIVLPASLLGAAWAAVSLNLLGTAAGVMGVIVFVAVGAAAWKRPQGHEACQD